MTGWTACLLMVLALGCGRASDQPVIVGVSGTVTINGVPLADGMVQFTPEKGRPSMAMTDANGGYTLQYSESVKGAIEGNHKVSITTGRVAISRGGKIVQPAVPEKIPAKYNTETTLTVNVTPASHQFDFQLSH